MQVTINEDLMVMCDIQAFEQVMTNLIENGIKYGTTDDSNTLSIGAKPVGQKIRFEIEDKGKGIPPGQRKRVFERFYRVQEKEVLENSGTGLGLSIVKNLVHLMEGSVGNEQAHPNGTIFWFTLNIV